MKKPPEIDLEAHTAVLICLTDCVLPLYDNGNLIVGEHVDCYDGKYIPAGGRNTERMVQAGEYTYMQ